MRKKLPLIALLLILVSCSTVPKRTDNIEDACQILQTHRSWEKAFNQAFTEHGVPPHVIMAVIYQESKFVYNARPPRKKMFGIATTRPSSAFGFSQALDGTWDWYKDKANKKGADRDYFPDAVDFIAWYITKNHERTGVSKWDARNQYLAYHEGTTGYLKKTYLKKTWLTPVANKVATNANRYRQQLSQCYQYPSL